MKPPRRTSDVPATPPNAIVVEVPLRVSSALNAREDWRVRARRVRAERTVVAAFLRQMTKANRAAVLALLDGGHGLDVEMTRIAPCKLDAHDNLPSALKLTADEVTAWLGLQSDRDARVSFVTLQGRRRPQDYAVRIAFAPRPRSLAQLFNEENEKLRVENAALRAKLAGAAE